MPSFRRLLAREGAGLVVTALILGLFSIEGRADESSLAAGFAHPPVSAETHTWWHWMDGNVTKEGITADLEAMHRVGIYSATIVVMGGTRMSQGGPGFIPPGPVRFMSPLFLEMVKFAASEARRLNMKIGMGNGAGWSNSGGPWIKPEDSMQVIVSSEKAVTGPMHFSDTLPQPPAKMNFYRDVRTIAFPESESGVLHLDKTIDLTSKMDDAGKLTWDVPAGNWIIERFGYTTNGTTNHPAPPEGTGLECNKLSREAAQAYWAGVFDRLATTLGPLMGTTFDHVLIDSYEVEGQNWSATFAAEFRQRRCYDLLPYLPVLMGQTVESREISDRVSWDVRRTIADLYADNYYGCFTEMAHRLGLRLEAETYGNGPFEDLQCAAKVDLPMGEFWWPGGRMMSTVRLAASVAHLHGEKLVGSEAFTSDDGNWDMTPFTMKAVGDEAFAAGVNVLSFHRYAMQPWLDRAPGMTMGHNGSNLERTNTWWEQSRAWESYFARCQFMLQQGTFVGDVLFFDGEDTPMTSVEPARGVLPDGYAYDSCDAEVILHRLSVRDGRLILPNGASYRTLVLSHEKTMTFPLLRKLKELADDGATIIGPKPEKSPSLSGYPACDEEIKKLADKLWGRGKITDQPLPTVLEKLKVSPDFTTIDPTVPFLYLHRTDADNDIYFISNQSKFAQTSDCLFRIRGKMPELWHPDTGKIEKVAAWSDDGARTRLALHLDPAGSVFVVFHGRAPNKVHPASLVATFVPETPATLTIEHATFGAENGPALETTSVLENQIRNGSLTVKASIPFFGNDPAPDSVKVLKVNYTFNSKPDSVTTPENGLLEIGSPKPPFVPASLFVDRTGGVKLEAREAGTYAVKMSDGTTKNIHVASVPLTQTLEGPWNLSFPPNAGAPNQMTLEKLISWSDVTDFGVKYFSGTATYHKTLTIAANLLSEGHRLDLDLGTVQVIAEVKLNGKDLGILWKSPYAVDITDAAKAGSNDLEVRMTNLWPNRIIGDEQLPEDSERDANGVLQSWPPWLLASKPSPTGRFTFTTWRHWKKSDPLLPSGLIGPVMLRPKMDVPLPR